MSIFFPRTKVAVIRGGVSHGYDDSIKTGSKIISVLRDMPEEYEPLDIFISKNGEWHTGGLVGEPQKLVRHADVVWNTLHNTFGESGEVQRLLENLKIPYTGTPAVSALMAMNKEVAKRTYGVESMRTPAHVVVTSDSAGDKIYLEIFRNLMHPVIVKSLDNSFPGTKVVHSYQELKDSVNKALEYAERVMVEELVKGQEVHCHIVEDARDQDLYAFLPTGNLRVDDNKRVEDLSKRVHRALGLRHYSSSKFIVTPKGNIYILGTNPFPHLHDDAHLASSLTASGWKDKDYVTHCIKLALK